MNDVTMNVGEAAVDAVLADRELLVIDSHEVEDSGVDVVDVGFIDDGVVADLVGFTIADAAFDSAAGHPGGEAMGLVIAAGFCGFLGVGESYKITTPTLMLIHI